MFYLWDECSFGHLVVELQEGAVNEENLRRWADAVKNKGSPLPHVWVSKCAV
jgi:hypothetical protein